MKVVRHWKNIFLKGAQSVWAFPALVCIILLLLTAFGINGSSTGNYYKLLYGNTSKDPSLIYGTPKSVRSDEYLVWSPRVAVQAQTDFPSFSKSVGGSGRDLVMTAEVPMKDWVGLFRPHTISYFILPFSNAFAFSWWFSLALLAISSYFFFLRILENKKILAVLFSASLALSPFLLWWFQVRLLLPLAYFFTAAIILMRLLSNERLRFIKSKFLTNSIYLIALTYIGASFGLILYVPFLLPIALVLLFFIVGYALDGYKSGDIKLKNIISTIKIVAIAIFFVSIIIAIFYFDRKEMIHAIASSEYPGHRKTSSGSLPFSPVNRFFDSYLMPLLQQPPTGKFYTNQSEAANFIFLLPFLLIPGIFLQVYDYLKNKRIYWTLLLVQALSVLFIMRITIPFGDWFFNLMLLDRVPNNRLMIGLGLLGFLQLIYLVKLLSRIRLSKQKWIIFVLAYGVLIFMWLLGLSRYLFDEFLVFDNSTLVVGVLAALFSAIVVSVLLKKIWLGVAFLFIFTLMSSFKIMPLQKGMEFYNNGEIINAIRRDSAPNDSWAVVDNFSFESFPLIAGRELVNGSQPYTDKDFWEQIDKDGRYEKVYNRQAHAMFITEHAEPNEFLPSKFAKISKDMELVKGNVFKVKFSCSKFVFDNVDFVLTTHELALPCLALVDEVKYPKVNFYIYKVDPS